MSEVKQRQLQKDRGVEGKGKRDVPPLCIGLAGALAQINLHFNGYVFLNQNTTAGQYILDVVCCRFIS